MVVATIIHYFILAAFCWMVCEGIVICTMIFSETFKGLLNSIYFLLAVGWGEYSHALIKVAAVCKRF